MNDEKGMENVELSDDEIKQFVLDQGADLCGVASVDRFDEAPKGFHPKDVMPMCHSVISFAVRFPVGTLVCKTPVPYTHVRNNITPKMDQIAINICNMLEKRGYLSVPVPTNEDIWDNSTERWRSIISQKHAAQAAGIGTIGRHSLLITPEYGSMVWLGSVITEAIISPDPLLEKLCNDCNQCVRICPVNALEETDLNQDSCWNNAFGNDEKLKKWVISCHKCRDICPYNYGSKNQNLKRNQ